MKNKIDKIVIEQVQDDSPDTSFIGEYTNKRSPWAIVRQGEYAGQYLANLPEDCGIPTSTREYAYFLPYAGGEKPGSKEYQEYGLQDFARMEGLTRGDWSFIGIIAKAHIITSNGTTQVIRSPGIWGIESDCGADYLKFVSDSELTSLRLELMALGEGFGKRAIEYAIKQVETVTK